METGESSPHLDSIFEIGIFRNPATASKFGNYKISSHNIISALCNYIHN